MRKFIAFGIVILIFSTGAPAKENLEIKIDGKDLPVSATEAASIKNRAEEFLKSCNLNSVDHPKSFSEAKDPWGDVIAKGSYIKTDKLLIEAADSFNGQPITRLDGKVVRHSKCNGATGVKLRCLVPLRDSLSAGNQRLCFLMDKAKKSN